MTYEAVDPHENGMLAVGDGHQIYWESCGNPTGKPAVVLHGGPGTGCTPLYRTFFDPARYRMVLFDQRGCGRSIPHAGDADTGLAANTTQHLLADIELLRQHIGIEQWLAFGLSWGSSLALAYAQQYPEHVSEMVLGMVVTSTRREIEWITRDVGRLVPAAWQRFRDGVPPADRGGDLADAYARLLESDEPHVREQAANDWNAWEDTHVAVLAEQAPDPMFEDERDRLAFARLVTHYWRHDCFLASGQLMQGADRLAGIHAVLVHGRLDISSPLDIPWELHGRWPDSDLVVVDEGAHSGGHGMGEALAAATDRFADLGP